MFIIVFSIGYLIYQNSSKINPQIIYSKIFIGVQSGCDQFFLKKKHGLIVFD